jgi:hypothetical protein
VLRIEPKAAREIKANARITIDVSVETIAAFPPNSV